MFKKGFNEGKLVNLKLLILWGVGIVIGPLFERDISVDKADQPTILLVKVLNNRK